MVLIFSRSYFLTQPSMVRANGVRRIDGGPSRATRLKEVARTPRGRENISEGDCDVTTDNKRQFRALDDVEFDQVTGGMGSIVVHQPDPLPMPTRVPEPIRYRPAQTDAALNPHHGISVMRGLRWRGARQA